MCNVLAITSKEINFYTFKSSSYLVRVANLVRAMSSRSSARILDDEPSHGSITSINDEANVRIKFPFKSIAIVTATSQISALVFCLAWSIRFNFHESTATHCRVANYLPSLSATLDFTPQRDVWRSCIGLAGVPRFFIAYLYYSLVFKSETLLFLHWLEVVALISLSIVDSIRYFAFHAFSVGLFLFTSVLHMSLVCLEIVKFNGDKANQHLGQRLEQTRDSKRKIAIVNFVAIVAALYLYHRHNQHCEPGVYSMFSFLEYIVIVANIVYHLQAYYDLQEYAIYVAVDNTQPKAPLAPIRSRKVAKKR